MLHKSGERPRNRVDPTCRKTFTMRLDIEIKPSWQDLTPGEILKDTIYAFINPANVSQVKFFHQVRSPGIKNLTQLQCGVGTVTRKMITGAKE